MLYLPVDGTGEKSAENMNEAFNEVEVNRCAFLNAAYRLYQFHSAMEKYHETQQQLSWIGKSYDPTAWVSYPKVQEERRKCVEQLKVLLQETLNCISRKSF